MPDAAPADSPFGPRPDEHLLGRMNDDLLPDLLAAVEQQLVSPQTTYVAKTFKRLLQLGTEPGEAKSQIALCLGEEMDQMLKKKRAFDEKSYQAGLKQLPFPPEEDE